MKVISALYNQSAMLKLLFKYFNYYYFMQNDYIIIQKLLRLLINLIM